MKVSTGLWAIFVLMIICAFMGSIESLKGGGPIWSEPVLYAIGTGMLGTQLFMDAFGLEEGEGLFHGVMEGIQELGTTKLPLVGAFFAVSLLALGNVQWTTQETEETETPKKPLGFGKAVGKYIEANAGLFVAIILNFIGDMGLVFDQDAFGIGEMMKIGLDNFILIICFAISVSNTSKKHPSAHQYWSVWMTVFIPILSFLIPIGFRYVKDILPQQAIQSSFRFFVPLVLIYTLLAELAPNAFVLEEVDDDGTVTTYAMDDSVDGSLSLKQRNVWFWLAMLAGILARIGMEYIPSFGSHTEMEKHHRIHQAIQKAFGSETSANDIVKAITNNCGKAGSGQ